MDNSRTLAVRVGRIPSPGALHDVVEQHMESSRNERQPESAAAR